MPERSVLIVDDERVVADSAAKILTLGGIAHRAVGSVEEALAELKRRRFDLLLVDLMLPGRSGLELIEAAAGRPPSVLVTGYVTRECVVEALRRGAVDFLPKPFDVDELLAVVERALRYGERLMQGAPKDQSGAYRLGKNSWARAEEAGRYRAGAAEAFFRTLERVRCVEPAKVGEELTQGDVLAQVGDGEREYRVYAPISGRVVGHNDGAKREPSLVGSDPFGAGWLVQLMPADIEADLKNLESA